MSFLSNYHLFMTLAWKIPWTEEPGKLQSMGSQRHDWATSLHFTTSNRLIASRWALETNLVERATPWLQLCDLQTTFICPRFPEGKLRSNVIKPAPQSLVTRDWNNRSAFARCRHTDTESTRRSTIPRIWAWIWACSWLRKISSHLCRTVWFHLPTNP